MLKDTAFKNEKKKALKKKVCEEIDSRKETSELVLNQWAKSPKKQFEGVCFC